MSGDGSLDEDVDWSVSGTLADAFTAGGGVRGGDCCGGWGEGGATADVGALSVGVARDGAGDGGSDASASPETATTPHPVDLPGDR